MRLRGSQRTPMRAIPSGSAWRTSTALHCEQSLKGLSSQHYESTYYFPSCRTHAAQGALRNKKNSQQRHTQARAAVRITCAMRLAHATSSNNSSNRRRRRRRSIMPCTDVCLVRACSTELQTASLVPQAAQHTRRLCGVRECLPNTSQWRTGCTRRVICFRTITRYGLVTCLSPPGNSH